MKVTPRDYQEEAVNCLFKFFTENKQGHPVVAMPTGTGKSVVIARFLERAFGMYARQKVLVGTHVKELIAQNYAEFKGMWPNAPAGIYSAGLKRKDVYSNIIFCGIASIIKNIEQFGRVDLFLVDECHLISPKEESMYRRAIAIMQQLNPNVRVIGFTATPWRAGQGKITEGGVFTHIPFDVTSMKAFNRFISEGYLVPLIPRQTDTILDVSGVHLRGGEFIEKELQEAVNKDSITASALKETIMHGYDRNHWLVFGSGIAHVIRITEMLNKRGISARYVHSKMPDKERDLNLKKWKEGKFRAIVNNGILTTGFNFKPLDLIVMLRPTHSTILWVQMLGRGTRPSPDTGKKNCIAEGQRVLTDKGLIPIEQITLSHKIWDGYEYVTHGGVYAKGTRKVIKYRGLIATPDHKVWSSGKWKSFSEVSKTSAHIAKGSIFGFAVKELDSSFPICAYGIRSTQTLFNTLRKLWPFKMDTFIQYSRTNSRLHDLSQHKSRPEMDCKSMYQCKSAVQQQSRQLLQKLWWAWNQVFISWSNNDGSTFNGTWSRGEHKTSRNRQNQQQWSLRGGKSSVGFSENKYEQPAGILWAKVKTFVSINLPQNLICGQHIRKLIAQGVDFFRNCRSLLQPSVEQTERRVWDIHNCGPRNRFTCKGLIVSNCLVLDFAGNTKRLGPINDPVIPRKKGKKTGEVPIKICDKCGMYNHISARFCGGEAIKTDAGCGAPFAFKTLINNGASTEALIKTEELPITETFNVETVTYDYYQTKSGKPPCIRVTYRTKFKKFTEYVLFEHVGFGERKARSWWKERTDLPFPENSRHAVQFLDLLKAPKQIRVIVNMKYPEIVQCLFDSADAENQFATSANFANINTVV